MANILDAADDVVVQLELGELLKSLEVVNLNDVLIGERKVGEFPKWLVIGVEDLVLLVVLHQVLPIQELSNCPLTTFSV